jgi:hypothetical protein
MPSPQPSPAAWPHPAANIPPEPPFAETGIHAPEGVLPHLVVPWATASDDRCLALLPRLQLPHLQRLLALGPQISHESEAPATDAAHTLTPPHERVLARELGLSAADGQLAWAAFHAPCEGPAAWFTPCHQEVGTGQVTLQDPDALALEEAHSRALLAALQPLAEEDGIALSWQTPTRWLARGPVFEGLATASLDRVVGRSLAPWLPMGAAAAPLRRLQSEAQMLFYTHPAHDERVAQRLLPVNAFWISGSGSCPPSARTWPPELQVNDALRTPALHGNWLAWQAVWQQLDATVLPAWLAQAETGRPAQITLCGERQATTLTWTPRSPWQHLTHKISSFFGTHRLTVLLQQL